MIVIDCNRISFKKGTHLILDHINLKVDEGEFLNIKGDPQSGKSTLFLVLGLMLKPTSGIINVFNTNYKNYFGNDTGFRNRAIGLVFEKPMLNRHLSVLENIALPLAHLDYDRKARHALAEEALHASGLFHKKERLPLQLSAFQYKLVELARATVTAAPLLLLDEPTKTMDMNEADKFYSKLYELSETNKTIILFQDKRNNIVSTRTLMLTSGKLTHDKIMELHPNE